MEPPPPPPPAPWYPPPGQAPAGPPPEYVPPWAVRPVEPGPAPGVSYAGFWVRLAAYVIDGLILSAIGFVFLIAWTVLVFAWLGSTIDLQQYERATTFEQLTAEQQGALVAFGLAFWLGFLLFWLVSAAYFVVFWSRTGGTPGMLALGLRVAREEDGRPISLGRGVARYIGYILDWLSLGLGFLWIGVDGRKQGWHDKIAGTLVVKRA